MSEEEFIDSLEYKGTPITKDNWERLYDQYLEDSAGQEEVINDKLNER